MAKKETMVCLTSSTGVEVKRTLSHAQRIFDIQERMNRTDWKLTDKTYELVDGSFRKKPSGKTDKKQD
jgi:hypothetical protein